jgi:hypothetical protein
MVFTTNCAVKDARCDLPASLNGAHLSYVSQHLGRVVSAHVFEGTDAALECVVSFVESESAEAAWTFLSFLGPLDPTNTQCASILHPVIRHQFRCESSEFHFGDSLLGRWD